MQLLVQSNGEYIYISGGCVGGELASAGEPDSAPATTRMGITRMTIHRAGRPAPSSASSAQSPSAQSTSSAAAAGGVAAAAGLAARTARASYDQAVVGATAIARNSPTTPTSPASSGVSGSVVNNGLPRASEMVLSEVQRVAVMSMVSSGQLTVERALEVIGKQRVARPLNHTHTHTHTGMHAYTNTYRSLSPT